MEIMDSREQAREAAAITISENLEDYSTDEIINAIRYLGRVKNVRELDKIIFPMKLLRPILDPDKKRARTDKMSLVKLEAIKQFEFLENLEILERIVQFHTSFNESHLLEVVRISGNKEYLKPLQYIIQNPDKFTEEIRIKANEELFKRRGRGKGIVAMDYILESNDRGREYVTKTRSSGLKQVFISYKKIDQNFADKVVSYLTEFFHDEFEILYDEFEVIAGDSLPKALNTMLGRSETSIMVWSPDYFSERGWAAVEKDGILSKRVREGKRFVPLFLRGSSIIPTLFSQYVYVDFREYKKNKDPVLFRRQMEKVIAGLRKV